MRYRTFLTYNVVGGVLWGTGVTSLGYALGNTVPHIEEYLHYIILGIIVVSFLPLVYEYVQARRKKKSDKV